MIFFTPEEMYGVLVPYYWSLMLDREIGPKLAATDTCVRLVHRNPDAAFVVDARRDPPMVAAGAGAWRVRPDVQVQVDSDAIHALWLGALTVPLALHEARSTVVGPVHRLAAVLDVLVMADGRYLTHLYSIGRPELG
jgi:hypothetical protein